MCEPTAVNLKKYCFFEIFIVFFLFFQKLFLPLRKITHKRD